MSAVEPRSSFIPHDDELLARIVHHEEDALGQLYDRYGGLVYSIALRVTGDRQTAEEVVQDVFQAVWQSAASYQPDRGDCGAWLVGIARHRAIDATRSRRERARTHELALGPELMQASSRHYDPAAADFDTREAIRAALATLPSAQRHAVELAYYSGLTRVEIAARLGEPLGTVKTRLRLAMLKLRDLLHPLVK